MPVLFFIGTVKMRQEFSEPSSASVLADNFSQRSPALKLLILGHLKSLLDGVRALLVAPGVDGELMSVKE